MGREIQTSLVNQAGEEVYDVGYICGRNDATNLVTNFIYYSEGQPADAYYMDFTLNDPRLDELKDRLFEINLGEEAELHRATETAEALRAARRNVTVYAEFVKFSDAIDNADRFIEEWCSYAEALISDINTAYERLEALHDDTLRLRILVSE